MFNIIINRYAPMLFSWNGTTLVPGQEAEFDTKEAAQEAVDWYKGFPGNKDAVLEIVQR